FIFSSRRRHTISKRDWSSDVCSSDLGAALSLACMTLAKKYLGLSVTGVSILGGVTHNLGQIVVAVLVVENVNLFYYFPALLIARSEERRVGKECRFRRVWCR